MVKIVETPEYKKEKHKQKALYSSYGKVLGSNFIKRLFPIPKNALNTSVLFWQNKLFALEEGLLAIELDQNTLEKNKKVI